MRDLFPTHVGLREGEWGLRGGGKSPQSQRCGVQRIRTVAQVIRPGWGGPRSAREGGAHPAAPPSAAARDRLTCRPTRLRLAAPCLPTAGPQLLPQVSSRVCWNCERGLGRHRPSPASSHMTPRPALRPLWSRDRLGSWGLALQVLLRAWKGPLRRGRGAPGPTPRAIGGPTPRPSASRVTGRLGGVHAPPISRSSSPPGPR